MKAKYFSLFLIVLFVAGCSLGQPPASTQTMDMEQLPTSSDGTFKLTSSAVTEGGALPKEFTCDGSSITLPLAWSGAPEGTKSFALIMHHIPGPGDSHWYWVLYNIPADVTDLERNTAGIGTQGNNSVNGETKYAPPCSKGPGEKIYTYTVYALSADAQLSVPAEDVNRDMLLDALKDITLASAALNVTYSR
jgi:Raf kinase inhibitor-like YbhB/YbcL family protein